MGEAKFHDFSATSIDGKATKMSAYAGKVVLVVNVASKCGFTPQYAGLEALYQSYRAKDFLVLGFPCNQFGGQEPGNEADIKQFCSTEYPVSFPLFAKVDVNGANAHPLYTFLKSQQKGILGTAGIKWNFTKFLVGRSGEVVGRYAPKTKPEDLTSAVEEALG